MEAATTAPEAEDPSAAVSAHAGGDHNGLGDDVGG
jgi:hypothetical protein